MSRNPALEALHTARYELETCATDERKRVRKKLYDLAEDMIKKSGVRMSIQDLLEITHPDYKEFAKQRRREGWARLKK